MKTRTRPPGPADNSGNRTEADAAPDAASLPHAASLPYHCLNLEFIKTDNYTAPDAASSQPHHCLNLEFIKTDNY